MSAGNSIFNKIITIFSGFFRKKVKKSKKVVAQSAELSDNNRVMREITQAEKNYFIKEKIEEVFEKYQKDSSTQNVHTPKALIDEMISKVDSFDDKNVLVVANYDVLKYIIWLNSEGRANYKSITFLTDIEPETLPAKDKTMYDTIVAKLSEPDTIDMMGKKFDIGFSNPPYNIEGNRMGNHKRKKKFIGKDFLEWLATICDKSMTICPTKGYWVGKNHNSTKKRLSSLGLKSVTKTTAFDKTITLDGVAIYNFSKGYEGDIKDDFNKDFDIPKSNLGDSLLYGSNKLIAGDLKDEKYEEGNDTLFLNCRRDVIENVDVSHLDDPTRGSWRVILSQIGGKEKYGRPRVIKPNDVITYSVVCWEVDSEEIGMKLVDYLEQDDIKKLAAEYRVSATNSKHNFKIIPTPDFM